MVPVKLYAPAVEGPVVSSLCHHPPDHILLEIVSTSEAIVEVDAGSRTVVADVVGNVVRIRLSFEVAACLLHVNPHRVKVIVCDCVESRVRRGAAIDPTGRSDCRNTTAMKSPQNADTTFIQTGSTVGEGEEEGEEEEEEGRNAKTLCNARHHEHACHQYGRNRSSPLNSRRHGSTGTRRCLPSA